MNQENEIKMASGTIKEIKDKPERLQSLDILRGFDMFWITGGEGLFQALAIATGWGVFKTIELNLHHAKWAGFTAYDLIFPLFIFIMGVAIPYALLPKIENKVNKNELFRKIFKRFIILVVFGILYNQSWTENWSDPRIASVLGQIGFAYFFAAIIFLNSNTTKSVTFWIVGILSGILILQNFIPVPRFGAGVLTPEGSINAFIDQLLLPGKLLDGTFDPEGILNNISAIGLALMGVFAGLILRSQHYLPYRKFVILLVIGVILVVLSSIIHPYYPIIKKAWTTTFNLRTGGLSFILLSVFYLVIDIWKYSRWGFYFKVIGVNAITVYLGSQFIDFEFTSKALLIGYANYMGDWGPVLISLGALILIWLGLYYLYRKKIFLKV